MTNKLKVNITDVQKDLTIPTGIRLLVRKCFHAVLRNENLNGSFEVNINFVNDEQMKGLNKEYRGVDATTDVLSFPTRNNEDDDFDINLETDATMLGDVALSIPKVYEQAEHFGHTLQREFAYLTVHSALHLLGYDHESEGLAAVHMREKEEAVLALLGLSRGASYVNPNV